MGPKKHGLKNFIIVIYYFHKDTNVILTDIETAIIKRFPFENLYNFKKAIEKNEKQIFCAHGPKK